MQFKEEGGAEEVKLSMAAGMEDEENGEEEDPRKKDEK